MTFLILGLLVFLGNHSLRIFAPALRLHLIESLGAPAFKGIYGAISLLGLILVIYGFGMARMDPIQVWNPPAFTRHITMTLMLPVFPLFLAA